MPPQAVLCRSLTPRAGRKVWAISAVRPSRVMRVAVRSRDERARRDAEMQGVPAQKRACDRRVQIETALFVVERQRTIPGRDIPAFAGAVVDSGSGLPRGFRRPFEATVVGISDDRPCGRELVANPTSQDNVGPGFRFRIAVGEAGDAVGHVHIQINRPQAQAAQKVDVDLGPLHDAVAGRKCAAGHLKIDIHLDIDFRRQPRGREHPASVLRKVGVGEIGKQDEPAPARRRFEKEGSVEVVEDIVERQVEIQRWQPRVGPDVSIHVGHPDVRCHLHAPTVLRDGGPHQRCSDDHGG